MIITSMVWKSETRNLSAYYALYSIPRNGLRSSNIVDKYPVLASSKASLEIYPTKQNNWRSSNFVDEPFLASSSALLLPFFHEEKQSVNSCNAIQTLSELTYKYKNLMMRIAQQHRHRKRLQYTIKEY